MNSSFLKYILIDFWTLNGDKYSSKYLFMSSGPWNFLFIIGFYLYFVKILGPKIMKTRPPFELTKTIQYYNLFMTAFNLWFVFKLLAISDWGSETWKCPKNSISDEKHRYTAFLGWTLLASRLIELMDTVFFILRKNFHQVSTLHLFHHTVVPICIWFFLKLSPTLHYGFGPLINSFIHTIMYSYYWLSTLGPNVRPYLWWKKYLTRLQLIQFVLIIINCLRVFFITDCQLSQPLMITIVLIAVVLLVLFTSFYLRTYNRNNPKLSSNDVNNDIKTSNKRKSI